MTVRGTGPDTAAIRHIPMYIYSHSSIHLSSRPVQTVDLEAHPSNGFHQIGVNSAHFKVCMEWKCENYKERNLAKFLQISEID